MAVAELQATEPQAALTVQPLFERTICYCIDLKKPGMKRKADMDKIETAADKEMLDTSKLLLDCDEWHAIVALDSMVRGFFKPENNIALPARFLKGGMYLVPVDLTEQVDAALDAFAVERARLVNEFVRVYPQRIEEAQQRLQDQFRIGDYLAEYDLRDKFDFRVRRMVFGTPSNLQGEALERELKMADQECREAMADIQQALRAGMAGLVGHLASKLSPQADGSRNRFPTKTLEKLQEFLLVFESRNITNDRELASMATRAREILAGVDSEALKAGSKNSDEARQAIGQQFTELASGLDSLLTKAPSRRIVLPQGDE